MHIIYQVKNKVTGHFYIGRTERALEARIGQHMQTAFTEKKKSPLQNHIVAYGIKNFEWSILNCCASKFYAIHLENKAIKDMQPYYNRKPGHKGVLSAGSRAKMGLTAKNRKPWNYARKGVYTKEQLQKFSLAKKGKPGHKWSSKQRENQLKSNKQCRKVIDLMTGNIFHSVSEVARSLDISRSAVKLILNGKIKNSKKCRLVYLSDSAQSEIGILL